MTRPSWILLVLLGSSLTTAALSQEKQESRPSTRLSSARSRRMGTTWAIVERDGANRKVDPYLSSLGQGETGTGTIASPPFVIDTDTIRFTICGHDGPTGRARDNYIALWMRAKERRCRRRWHRATTPCRSDRGTWPPSRAPRSASRCVTETRAAPSRGWASAALMPVLPCASISETAFRTVGVARNATPKCAPKSFRGPCRFDAT